MEGDIQLFCEEQQKATYAQLVERFGKPQDVASDFFAEADAKAVNRFAYSRLRAAYLLLAIVLVVALSAIVVKTIDYVQTKQLISNLQPADNFIHPDGTECNVFWVRTNFRGEDLYWEYHSCMYNLRLIPPSEEADGTEPYATDIYLNRNGSIEHWTFGQDHLCWVRVYDVGM